MALEFRTVNGVTVAVEAVTGGDVQAFVAGYSRDDGVFRFVNETTPMPSTPQMTSGGNMSVQTASAGATYTAFASQLCKQLTIVNDTGVTIEVQQGGAGVAVPVFDRAAFSFFGITNANQLGLRRGDTSNTQVTVKARWES